MPSNYYMTKAEEETPVPNVVEVKVTSTGGVTVSSTSVPPPPASTPTPVETPDAKWATFPPVMEEEVTAVRKLREARANAGAASESLDEVISRFRKKSGELLAQQAEKDKKDTLCLPADPPPFP